MTSESDSAKFPDGGKFAEYTPRLQRVELDPQFAEEAARVARSLIGYRVGNQPGEMFALIEACVRRAYSGERIQMLESRAGSPAGPIFDARSGAIWLTSLFVCMSTIAAHAIHAKIKDDDADEEDDFNAAVSLYEELCFALQIDGITH